MKTSNKRTTRLSNNESDHKKLAEQYVAEIHRDIMIAKQTEIDKRLKLVEILIFTKGLLNQV